MLSRSLCTQQDRQRTSRKRLVVLHLQPPHPPAAHDPAGLAETQIERREKLFGCHTGVGGLAPWGSWPSPDQNARTQPADQVAADLLAEYVLERVPGDGLMIAAVRGLRRAGSEAT